MNIALLFIGAFSACSQCDGELFTDCQQVVLDDCPQTWAQGIQEECGADPQLVSTQFIECTQKICLCGYVPSIKEDGECTRSQNRGITVASGVDLGFLSAEQIETMGIQASLRQKLEPYLGYKADPYTFLQQNPLVLTQAEAEEINSKVKKYKEVQVENLYNDEEDSELIFSDLELGVRTAAYSIYMAYGTTEAFKEFWDYIVQRDWSNAIKYLRELEHDFQEIRDSEADIMAYHLQECQISFLDLCFLLDESGSISYDHYEEVLQFAADIVDMFEIGGIYTHIASIGFSGQSIVRYYFTGTQQKDNIKISILSFDKMNGGTSTWLGLRMAYQQVFTTNNGARDPDQNVRVLITLTDGRSGSFTETTAAAQEVRDHGIITYSIGVGSGINWDQVQNIAGDEQRMFYFDNFDQLICSVASLQKKTCLQPLQMQTNEPSPIELQQQVYKYFQAEVTNGIGVSVCVTITAGAVIVYGSSDYRNPYQNEYQVAIEVTTTSCIIILVNNQQSRRVLSDEPQYIYYSVKGIDPQESAQGEIVVYDKLYCSDGTETDEVCTPGCLDACPSDCTCPPLQISDQCPQDCRLDCPDRCPCPDECNGQCIVQCAQQDQCSDHCQCPQQCPTSCSGDCSPQYPETCPYYCIPECQFNCECPEEYPSCTPYCYEECVTIPHMCETYDCPETCRQECPPLVGDCPDVCWAHCPKLCPCPDQCPDGCLDVCAVEGECQTECYCPEECLVCPDTCPLQYLEHCPDYCRPEGCPDVCPCAEDQLECEPICQDPCPDVYTQVEIERQELNQMFPNYLGILAGVPILAFLLIN